MTEGCRQPGRGAMALVTRGGGNRVIGGLRRAGVAGVAGAGCDAHMIEARRNPGAGAVAAVAACCRGYVIAGLAGSGATVVTGHAAARRDVYVLEACA